MGVSGLAARYGVPQVHGCIKHVGPFAVSTSVHSWEELKAIAGGFGLCFYQPCVRQYFEAGDIGRTAICWTIPPGPLPCRPVGLGGVSADTIGLMMARGWTGAALLGWIWEEPREAVSRFEQLKKIIDGQAKGIGGSGI